MKVLRETDYPEGKFTLCFIGYGDEADQTVIELTYNHGRSQYVLGDAFGHLAIGTDDIRAACNRVRGLGYKVTREPGPMKHGTTVIAFVEDPTGYKIRADRAPLVTSLRIIGGTARGRRIQGPREPGLRPTADRVRQVIFDVLGQSFDGGEVLDLYAGTGALALEALSRGASQARLVDHSPEALELSQQNATTLGFRDRVFTSRRELPAGLAKLDLRPVDLLFADPPYDAATACNEVLHWLAASGILSPGGVAILEHSRRIALDTRIAGSHPLQQTDRRLFGDTEVSFYTREN